MHSQRNVVTAERRILNGVANFCGEIRSQGLVSIDQENPVVRERKILHRPLALLWPAALIMELHDLGSEGARDFGRRIRALRVDDIDFANLTQGFETTRKILLFV